jgi:hypothetical protein
VFVALLYVAGRSYANGYFTAMNIPEYLISFSLWEYGAAAWIPLFLYPVGIIALSGLIWGIFNTIVDWTSPLRVRIWDWLSQKVTFKLPALHLPKLSHETKLWFLVTKYAFRLLLLIVLVTLTLMVVNWSGEVIGKTQVLEHSARVELVTNVPMALDDSNLIASQPDVENLYIYKGFHLLTFNAGKYYLFKEVDPVTCKPVKVYVIDSVQSLQVNLLPAVSLADQCNNDG